MILRIMRLIMLLDSVNNFLNITIFAKAKIKPLARFQQQYHFQLHSADKTR